MPPRAICMPPLEYAVYVRQQRHNYVLGYLGRAYLARDVATLRRLRLYRNSIPRGASAWCVERHLACREGGHTHAAADRAVLAGSCVMLGQDLAPYIDLQHSLGFKFRIQRILLSGFVRFAEAQGDRHIKTARVLVWAARAPSLEQRRNRLVTVRRFALAMRAENALHQVPPADALGNAVVKRRPPYIYSADDVARLIHAAAQLQPSGAMYATLFGLLGATGMRISEALAGDAVIVDSDRCGKRDVAYGRRRMTALAPYLSTFLREHLPKERRASQHTCEAYASSFQLLVCFAADRFKIRPSALDIEQFDVKLLLAFLEYIETKRGNSARTRNAKLAAIISFFRFLEYRLPSCPDQSRRVRAIPKKKTDQALIDYLTREEMLEVLSAPTSHTVSGVRDRAMLHLAFVAGLRVSELVGLRVDQLDGETQSTIHIIGKGRRERVLPLWKETTKVLKAWLAVRPPSDAAELFLKAVGCAMTRSGFEYILAKHVATATLKQPSIATKRVSPHVLRHTCAMHTLIATRDVRKVSLWLGHTSLQSTEIYLRADPSEKLEALAAVAPSMLKPGCFKAPDELLAMLKDVGHN